jgi:hypothetical protein
VRRGLRAGEGPDRRRLAVGEGAAGEADAEGAADLGEVGEDGQGCGARGGGAGAGVGGRGGRRVGVGRVEERVQEAGDVQCRKQAVWAVKRRKRGGLARAGAGGGKAELHKRDAAREAAVDGR